MAADRRSGDDDSDRDLEFFLHLASMGCVLRPMKQAPTAWAGPAAMLISVRTGDHWPSGKLILRR